MNPRPARMPARQGPPRRGRGVARAGIYRGRRAANLPDHGDDWAPAVGPEVEAAPMLEALPAFPVGADDLTGDFIPPPGEPEDEIPEGDVFPPEGEEPTTTFIGDDSSIVELQDLSDSFAFLLA